ncbi:MAG TPA: AgmX/PglI C-terminal domain-containing protein [Myxococcota bacterium]|nr:AgmX/PglI C-terminal domain-containing protein [Myxococcota bacterium]HRY94809.1 AgmX/PglI C-terminal domain-containing protein [Myxococcota bacterium]
MSGAGIQASQGERQPELPRGDWLFKLQGEVLGPVSSREIVERMFVGEIDESTQVSLEEGAWVSVQQLPAWHPFLYQAKAKLRAERARAEAELAARRRKLRHLINIGIGAGALVVTSFAVVYLLIVQNPYRNEQNLKAWAERHVPLIGLPAAMAGGSRAGLGPSEVESPELRAINIEKILIEDAPELVALKPDSAGGRRRPRPDRPPEARPDAGTSGRPDTAEVANVGQLGREQIESKVYSSTNMKRLKGCLVEEIRRNSQLPDRVVVSFSIKNDGRVHNVQMGDVRLEEGNLHQCFRRQLDLLKFREFQGQVQNVTIPFDWR